MTKYRWTDEGERVKVKAPPKPPVTGIPAERKRCVGCGKPLGYRTDDETERRPYNDASAADGFTASMTGFRTVATARVFSDWNAYGEGFHSLRCALKFANAAYRAGYRLVTK